MFMLPTQLAALVNVADKQDSTRFSLSNVLLEVGGSNWKATATNSKVLLQVEGALTDASKLPAHELLAAQPDGGKRALIGESLWKSAFTAAKKLGRKLFGGVIAAVGERGEVALGSTDGINSPLATGKDAGLRFVNVDTIMEVSGQVLSNPAIVVSVDAKRLHVLLGAIIEIMGGGRDEAARIDLQFIDSTNPIGVTAKTDELTLRGLIMPMA